MHKSKTQPLFTNAKESATRKKIDLILNNLGWETNESSKQCNVFTERCKTVAQNNLLCGNKPDYVLYQSGTDDALAIIETKKPGEN
jgi:type I restriction enzyme M protein